MGIIITSIIFLLIGVLLWNIGENIDSDGLAIFGIMSTILSSFALTVSLICLIDLQKGFDKKIDDYQALKEIVEYNRENMSEFERVELIRQIHENNKSINEHKNYYNSFWFGVYYSEEIGKLPYLK